MSILHIYMFNYENWQLTCWSFTMKRCDIWMGLMSLGTVFILAISHYWLCVCECIRVCISLSNGYKSVQICCFFCCCYCFLLVFPWIAVSLVPNSIFTLLYVVSVSYGLFEFHIYYFMVSQRICVSIYVCVLQTQYFENGLKMTTTK